MITECYDLLMDIKIMKDSDNKYKLLRKVFSENKK